MAGPLDHVTIGANDLATSLAFYDAVLGALGLVRLQELRDEEEDGAAPVEAAAWGVNDESPVVWLVAAPVATQGAHLAFRARTQHEVETFYGSGLRNGGVAHTAPRAWTLYRPGEFHAIVCDPAGNLVEAVYTD